MAPDDGRPAPIPLDQMFDRATEARADHLRHDWAALEAAAAIFARFARDNLAVTDPAILARVLVAYLSDNLYG